MSEHLSPEEEQYQDWKAPQTGTSEAPMRPGGELKGRPIQSSDGSWRDIYGTPLDENLARDYDYAAKFWATERPTTTQEMYRTIIENSVQYGELALLVSPEGITEDVRAKLSAFRTLAHEMGYTIGQFQFHPNSDTVTAPINKIH